MINNISPEYATVTALRNRGLQVALAESCTGGGAAKRLTDIAGASEVFECGIVCYSNCVKHSVLGVSKQTLELYGAVSEQTAAELAENVRILGKADIGVSVTGFAGPTADEYGKDVGLIFVAVSDGAETKVTRLETADSSEGCRERNRTRAEDEIFRLILNYTANH